MRRTLLKSKLHRATVTEANLEYEGSLTIDRALMLAANIVPYERVEVYNITNGNRLNTYAIEGEEGGGTICANGAAAHQIRQGDLVIIATYAEYEEDVCHAPRLILLDDHNRVKADSAQKAGDLSHSR